MLDTPQHHAARRWNAAAASGLASLAIALAGCASPGNPRPPSLRLQQVAGNLSAERLGDQVLLRWTTPDATTDGGPADPPLTAVVCREQGAPGAGPCNPILRMATAPGAAGAADTLPAALLQSQSLLTYRVELLNRRGRSAGLSMPAFAAAGPAPAAIVGMALVSRPGGTLITWAPARPGARIELTRTLVLPDAGSREGAAPSTPRRPPLAADPAAPVLLRPATRAGTAEDGMIDSSVLAPALDGKAFRYVAQRVETVSLGGHTLELRGLPSPPQVFTYTASFAPEPPAGVVAIPSLSPIAIDLSWEPATQQGVIGYNVYRREARAAAYTLLTANPLAAPAFRDVTVVAGRAYSYRVTALDRHRNESAPSADVQETVSP